MENHSGASPLTWKDLTKVVMRRRWNLMGPFFALGFLGFIVAQVWPVLYLSEARILVDQSNVPNQYVTPNIVTNVQARVESLKQQILSRSRLWKLIGDMNLYRDERARSTPDEVVTRMRKDITIEPIGVSGQTGELTAFSVAYAAPSPQVAQQVVNKLASLFIDDNLKATAQQSSSTTNFLQSQLEQARQNLQDKEKRLQEFKLKYLGELPEQERSNLQILSSLEMQLGAASAALDRDELAKADLEAIQTQERIAQPLVGGTTVDGQGASPEATLRALRARLAGLETKYTQRYPEVVQVRQEIAKWEALVSREQDGQARQTQNRSASPGQTPPDQPEDAETSGKLKALSQEMKNRTAEMNGLRVRIRELETRLNLTPVREQEMTDVAQDAANARQIYESLLQKASQSQLATNLEEQQNGEQFRMIDSANLPTRPIQPNRLEIIVGGWLVGLVGGVGLAGLCEAADTRYRNDQDIRNCVSVPVLASVPILLFAREERRRETRQRMELAAIALLLLMSVASGTYALWVK